ncbi:NmrA/HSCARG family protein [Actinoplanes sp. NPDC051513]|uniref:NmrA/HSCARG family protein n=1 Tax=Actinoplanes sp. NPDC051513 TaxID=3363908 RepID=UPI0037B4E18D
MSRTIVVTGATGNQGGATARSLLRDGWHVRALVRDLAAPAARALHEAGAELVQRDMTDRDGMTSAMRDAYGVFSIQPANGAPHFDGGEVRMGINVAEAARTAGVGHLVYASVGGADRDSGISHWNTKWEIEQHIAKLDLPVTVLRPVMFMENHADAHYGVTGEFSVLRMVAPGTRVQMIAAADIGEFAALAFADPDRYLGRALELAGDELTREEAVTAIERATGHEIQLPPIPREALEKMGANLDDLDRAKNFGGWHADIPALRALHPGLLTFPAWLERDGRIRFERLFAAQS